MSGAAITQIGASVSGSPTVVTLTTTGAGNFTVPVGFQSTVKGANGYANQVEVYAAGGPASVTGNNGGGGAGYSASTNLILTPGASIPLYVASAPAPTTHSDGDDGFFGASTFAASTVAAKGGKYGNAGTSPGAGGLASAGIGAIKSSGGSGYSANAGGGAAGPTGAGGNASGTTGGSAGGGLAGAGGDGLGVSPTNPYGGGGGMVFVGSPVNAWVPSPGAQGVIVISYYTVS